ncbi:polysaccharide deacetylase [Neiella marina]|uniref:Polysaccharide deacetylase n=2 Tax=Neiella marina TaxID=508461 RepID=A0A8J2XQD6_9GAMM|nr:polysaccharide deacetylase [Neiella marina]
MVQSDSIVNAMTVDVEDYFHVSAFSRQVTLDDWGKRFPLRVEASTHKTLALFDKHRVKATFFILGWVAEQCPDLVKAIAAQGHEIACHGYAHQRATEQDRQTFMQDVARCKHFLEDITGTKVAGYRAPSFSFDERNEWAFDVIKELGFSYSSSTYPVKHDLYGVPHWPRFKHMRPEGITEIPIPTTYISGRSIPIGGGGYFRLYPYALSRQLIRRFLRTEQQPYSFYFHPWELDPEQPRMSNAPLKSKFRHYLNLGKMESRLERLLTDFNWSTMQHAYQLNSD